MCSLREHPSISWDTGLTHVRGERSATELSRSAGFGLLLPFAEAMGLGGSLSGLGAGTIKMNF